MNLLLKEEFSTITIKVTITMGDLLASVIHVGRSITTKHYYNKQFAYHICNCRITITVYLIP